MALSAQYTAISFCRRTTSFMETRGVTQLWKIKPLCS